MLNGTSPPSTGAMGPTSEEAANPSGAANANAQSIGKTASSWNLNR